LSAAWSELGRRHFLAATRTPDRTEELIREEIARNAHERTLHNSRLWSTP
jgi:hypothetical protein